MKTHLVQDDCSRVADLLEDRRRCRPHFVCGQWTSALQRESGRIPVVVAGAATAAAPQSSVR
jgi:hypothetical protein